jgi:iron complex outermembrane receptor protein
MDRTSLKFSLLSGVACLSAATAAPAWAQSDDIAPEDIIVTARRVEERLQDVPISITVFDPKQLANRNITVANDLATYTPSLSTNERYGPEKSSFSLRGFNQDQSTAPTVGVYFADVVGVRAQGGTTSGNTVGAGSFMDLQNVQVLKGPQGTLFGRNTTGGAILLVPKKPTGEYEGYVEGSAGNYDMKRVQAAVNLPLADSFRLRLAGDRMNRDGYMHNLSGIGAKDYNDRNYLALRLSAVGDLTPNLQTYTIAHYSKSNTNGYASRVFSCDPNATTGTRGLTASSACEQIARQNARGDSLYDVETAVTNPYINIKQWQVINTTTWNASDTMTIKNIASYGEFRERAHFDLYTSNFKVKAGGFNLATISPQIPMIAPAGTQYKYIEFDASPGQDASSQSTLTEELQLQGTGFEGKLSYVLGGYLEFSRPRGDSAGRTGIFLNCTSPENLACANPLLVGSISESRTRISFDNHGVFGQATYNFSGRFSLTAGGRYTFDNIVGSTSSTRASLDPAARNPASFLDPATGVRITRQCTDTFRHNIGFIQDPGLCRTQLTNKSTAPTWLIDLDYKPTGDLLVYGKYARGYRQGGLNFTNPGLETWKPEHLDSFEVGTKTSFHGKVSGFVNLAAFYNKLRNQQVFGGLTSGVPSVAGGAAIVNAGKSRIWGIEVDGSVTVFDSLRFDLGYAHLDTKVQEIDVSSINLVGTPFIAIAPTVSPGSEFTLSPKNKVTLTGTYTLPLEAAWGRLSVAGTMTYTSRQIANGSVPANVGVLPSRTLVNLNINWEKVGGTPIDAAFFVTNLTKKVYAVNTGGGYNSAGLGDLLIGEPRMYGFRLRYSFGR